MAKAKKDMTPKERREQMIKDRANRLAKEAAKQGITPAELKKKKKDTFLNVVGGAATMVPIARVMQLANTAYKAYKGAGTAAKVTKTATKAKPAASKTATKAKTPATTAASKANRATSQGGRTAAQARKAAKAKPAPKSTAKPKSRKMTPASSTRVDRAKKALLGGAVASATLATIDDIRKSGTGKAKAASVATPTSRPKRPTTKRRTGMSEGNTVAGSSGRRGGDPRKGFASKATPGKKKAAKSKDPRGNQIKAISSLPSGAKRKFGGSYDSKKEKLRNIGGKTYVFSK